MSAEQIQETFFSAARVVARSGGRDTEVTTIAMQLACKRIAELEGAREKAKEGASPDFQACKLKRAGFDFRCTASLWNMALDELDRRSDVMTDQAAELERLRSLVVTVWKDGSHREQSEGDAHYSANDPDWLVNIRFTDLDRAPAAQAEPQLVANIHGEEVHRGEPQVYADDGPVQK